MGSLQTKEVRYVSDCRVQISNVLIRANDEGSSPHFEEPIFFEYSNAVAKLSA